MGALIGPSQVGARLIEMVFGTKAHPVWNMLAATGLMAIGVAGLTTAAPIVGFLVAYGAGNGICSIARRALPLVLFAPGSYAVIMGRIAMPALLAAALAPVLGDAMIDRLRAVGTLQILAPLALVPVGEAVLSWRVIRILASVGHQDIGQNRRIIAGPEAKEPLTQHDGIA